MALLRLLFPLLYVGCSYLTDSEALRFRDTTELEVVDVSDGVDRSDTTDTTDSRDTQPETSDTAVPDTAAPDAPERRLVVRHSGESGCTLEYRSLLNCPTACAWTLVVDASESVGYGAFAWRFSATNSYRVSPSAASGARVTIEVDTPECGLTPPTVGPGKVIAEVSADGGGYAIAASIDFAVQQVSSCGDDDLCPAP